MKLPRRVAALCAVLAFSGCVWRPPIIPPLASPDGSTMGGQDAAAASDSGAWSDSSAPLTDREACDRAAAANDGSAPEVVSNNGRDVSCAAIYSDAAASDARASDSAADAQPDGGESADADANADAGANPDANPDGSSDAASG